MCIATPAKILKINKKWATVDAGDHAHKVDISLLKNVRVGDYLLVHEQLAVNKLPKTEAKAILKMVGKCLCCHHEH